MAATGVLPCDGPSGSLMSACGQHSAPCNPQTVLVGVSLCSRDKRSQITELSRLASEHYFALCSRASFPELM